MTELGLRRIDIDEIALLKFWTLKEIVVVTGVGGCLGFGRAAQNSRSSSTSRAPITRCCASIFHVASQLSDSGLYSGHTALNSFDIVSVTNDWF